ncbi:aminotransferase class IV [Candidatus Odyssella acanthamoebae]|uniref:aminotransferase class IV n=1 Tax=Candidatus Odyssella acanthamoebae TaxID=91604 RepID=UPI00068CCECF|nr:aminotransferase class IV [Candidatus Paracaedibacter acanthamoebae]
MIIYLNDEYVESSKANISPADRGLMLGDGVFETLFYNGMVIECLRPHFDRLVKGATLFQIPFNLVISEFKAILLAIIDRNNLQGIGTALRFTLTRGPGERGLATPQSVRPTLLVTAQPYQRRQQLLHISFSQYCFQQSSILSGVKHLGYQLPLLGRLEAENRGLDDVLFFNDAGYLVSATTANVFILSNSVLVTPPLSDGCLPGVMRAKIIQEMQKTMTPVRIDHITRQDVEEATKIFLTNSLIGSALAVYNP